MKDKLAKILTPELLAQVTEALGGNLDYVPRTRLNEVIGERDTARHDLDEAKAKATKLDAAEAKVTELTTQLQTTNADWQKKLDLQVRSTGIEKALTSAGAKNTKAALALLDDTKFGDDLKGLDAEIQRVQKSDAYLFGSAGGGGAPGGTGKSGGDPTAPKAQQLQTQLAEAQKNGNTAMVIKLTRDIYELNKAE